MAYLEKAIGESLMNRLLISYGHQQAGEKYLKLPTRRMPSSPLDHSPKRQAKKEVAKLGEIYRCVTRLYAGRRHDVGRGLCHTTEH